MARAKSTRPHRTVAARENSTRSALGCAGPVAHVEINDGGGRKRIQRCAQVGHGRGEDSGDQQARNPVRHIANDEGGEDAVGFVESNGRRREAIKDPQHGADQQEEREVKEHRDAAAQQRQPAIAPGSGRRAAVARLTGRFRGWPSSGRRRRSRLTRRYKSGRNRV